MSIDINAGNDSQAQETSQVYNHSSFDSIVGVIVVWSGPPQIAGYSVRQVCHFHVGDSNAWIVVINAFIRFPEQDRRNINLLWIKELLPHFRYPIVS